MENETSIKINKRNIFLAIGVILALALIGTTIYSFNLARSTQAKATDTQAKFDTLIAQINNGSLLQLLNAQVVEIQKQQAAQAPAPQPTPQPLPEPAP